MKYFYLLRPKHWIKNLFLFAAPFFGGTLLTVENMQLALPVFASFSLCASAVYIINDIKDIEHDRLHPKKKNRPIASGTLSKKSAVLTAFLLAIISFAIAFGISRAFSGFIFIYLFVQTAYSFYLKNIAVADIFCIASGFVIRVLAGGAAFVIEVSNWLTITMFMISLVLASGKRIGEAAILNENAMAHRKSLDPDFVSVLNEILQISAASSLIAYALYTIEQSPRLIYTVPVVTFGLFRYLLLCKKGGGDPTEALTRDKWLAFTVLIWLLMIGFIRYN